MQNIKLVAIDLDGTLLDDDSQVSTENLQAISELNKRGILLCPCTGRAMQEISTDIKDNADIRYILESNGATILDKQTNKKIQRAISNAIALEIFDVLAKYKTSYVIHQDGFSYCASGTISEKNLSYYNYTTSAANALSTYSTMVEDYDTFLRKLDNIEVVAAFFHDKDECIECKHLLSKNEELLVVQPNAFNIEIINKNAGKGNSLLLLKNVLGIKTENVIAVGDSGNDIPMMREAGIRLAVKNACDELKDICDKTICSNNEHVVKYILENVL